MRYSIGVVRDWELFRVENGAEPMDAASLTKQILAHLALHVFDDLDTPVHADISVRHILSHTSGLPNWRPSGQGLTPLRPPGTHWGYSGEAFVLLQEALQRRAGTTIDVLAREHVFDPLGMGDSRFDHPEVGYHGYRQLVTTAADYGRFLAHVLTIDDERWQAQWSIDDELAWGAGWGLEVGPPVWGWQWGLNPDAGNFVIGCPPSGDGVVVFTDDPDGHTRYREIVERELPGDHPSLRVETNATWLELFA